MATELSDGFMALTVSTATEGDQLLMLHCMADDNYLGRPAKIVDAGQLHSVRQQRALNTRMVEESRVTEPTWQFHPPVKGLRCVMTTRSLDPVPPG